MSTREAPLGHVGEMPKTGASVMPLHALAGLSSVVRSVPGGRFSDVHTTVTVVDVGAGGLEAVTGGTLTPFVAGGAGGLEAVTGRCVNPLFVDIFLKI